MTGQVLELKPHGGNRVDKIDVSDSCLELRRRTILVTPVKELLDGTAEQVGSGIAENRRVLVEGGLHVVTFARPGTIDVVLDGLGDRLTLAHVSRYITHGS